MISVFTKPICSLCGRRVPRVIQFSHVTRDGAMGYVAGEFCPECLAAGLEVAKQNTPPEGE